MMFEGMAGVMMMPVLVVSGLFPLILYVIARWRSYREAKMGAPFDPQVGIKTALNFFLLAGFQVLLLGLFMIVNAIITDAGKGELRVGAALAIAGGIILGVHFWALTRTNQDAFPMVGRMFSGLNMVETGVVGMIALVMTLVAILSEGDFGDFGKTALSLLLVYGTAWVTIGVRFMNRLSTSTPDLRVGPPPPTA
jgi:hypothetical protein